LANSNGPGYAKNAFHGYLDKSSRWFDNPVNRIYSRGSALDAIPLDPIKSRRSRQ